jgi:DnaJ-class molecular chaperone
MGVAKDAKPEEIEARYQKLKEYFGQASADPTMKLFFDDVTLAYTMLKNEQSRKDYDEYIDSYWAMSGLYHNEKD